MKLLFFLYSLEAGGAERVTASLANHWAAEGWSITVVTLCGSDRDFYALHPRIVRIGLNLAGVSRGPFGAFRANISRVRALRQLLLQQRPQVAVAMMSTASVLLSWTGWGLGSVVRVGAERIHPPQLPIGRVWGVLRWLGYRYLDAVVAQTTLSARWLLRHTRARTVVVIENPLPSLDNAQPPRVDPDEWLASGDNLLLAMGRLTHQKGFDVLLRAWAPLADRYPSWKLVILGEGPERTALEIQKAHLGLLDSVQLPGRAGNVGDWYRRADLFVLSSRFEGFPNVLAEAMAHGLAAVSTNCPTGPAELVHSGVDGSLVPVEDVDSLRLALAALIEDPMAREAMGRQALGVTDRLALPVVAARWQQLFAQLGS